MLDALANPEYRELAWKTAAAHRRSVRADRPAVAVAGRGGGLDAGRRPLIFPTSDDQQAGLVGGGAVDAGQVAVILGNSAVVNSSSAELPASGSLDAMRLELGAVPVDALLQQRRPVPRPRRRRPAGLGRRWSSRPAPCPPGCERRGGVAVRRTRSRRWASPAPRFAVAAARAADAGRRFRASLEALAYLIALGVREHEAAGQKIDADHRVRRHRPQRPDVRNPGDGAGPAAGAVAVVRRAGTRRRGDGAGGAGVVPAASRAALRRRSPWPTRWRCW